MPTPRAKGSRKEVGARSNSPRRRTGFFSRGGKWPLALHALIAVALLVVAFVLPVDPTTGAVCGVLGMTELVFVVIYLLGSS